MWCDYGYSEEEEKPTEESIGLSLDEAKKLVKEKVEKMGITDLQFSNWNYAVCKSFEGDNSSDNEGHIFSKITNDSNENKTLTIPADTGFMQGIFVEYGITVDDDATEIRNGGFGSTTAKQLEKGM